jgi:hypothetical protein
MGAFCEALGSNTSLESLSLHNISRRAANEPTTNTELTRNLVSLLKQKTLRSLQIQNYNLEMVTFCQELEQNTSLQCLSLRPFPGGAGDIKRLVSMLEHHNKTVSIVYVGGKLVTSTTDRALVGYYSRLSRFGRGELHSPDLNPADLADLLSRAVDLDSEEDYDCLDPVHRWVPEPLANVLYGLLHELPSLWSGFAHAT